MSLHLRVYRPMPEANGNRTRRGIGRGLEAMGIAGLDFVAQRRSLAHADNGIASGGGTAAPLRGFSLDRREARCREFAADQIDVAIGIGCTGEEPRRIVGKKRGDSIA